MKDITTTSFGLLITYLLPGLACLICVSFWLPPFQEMLRSFVKSDSDVGSFLFVLLVSLILGLVLNAIRWAVYEKMFLRKRHLPSHYFAEISKNDRLLAVHTTIDENFRYHQFYGNLSLVLPAFGFAMLTRISVTHGPLALLSVVLASLFIEVVVVCIAVAAFVRFLGRSKSIMEKGGRDG